LGTLPDAEAAANGPMANSKYEYIKAFESRDEIIPDVFFAVRVDGRVFRKFAERHGLEKPVDERLVTLLNETASHVMQAFSGQVGIAYGHSDEYSFIFRRDATIFGRRTSKLLSVTVSLFTSAFVCGWAGHLGGSTPLRDTPSFDARLVVLPSFRHVRDYLAWRQVDCHVNCQYNTAFWLLVQKDKLSLDDAHKTLRGTDTGMKNEIMWQRGVNYNNLPQVHRKGTVLVWDRALDVPDDRALPKPEAVCADRVAGARRIICLHCDLIRAPDDDLLLFGSLQNPDAEALR